MPLSPEVAREVEHARRQAIADIEARSTRQQATQRKEALLIALVVLLLSLASALLINFTSTYDQDHHPRQAGSRPAQGQGSTSTRDGRRR